MRKFLITLSLMLMTMSSNLFAQGITPGKEVDLGLPSGTIWAGWNVGASSPEEYGGYYAWGETEEKSVYNWDTYKYRASQLGEYVNIGSNISGTQYDVARQKWGVSWRVPTIAEVDELISKCTWIWYEYKGVNGYKVTGPNGNSIFLPAAGHSLNSEIIYGSYWSASLYEGNDNDGTFACFLGFYYGSISSNGYNSRMDGNTVRPVKSK